MSWEKARTRAGIGFTYEVPVPLPMLGHRTAFKLGMQGLSMRILVELKSMPPRVGGISIRGGISYHNRDRFGIFAGSKVELRIESSLDGLFERNIYRVVEIGRDQSGDTVAGIFPGDFGTELCAVAFNHLVDIQTVSFGTHWVPHITVHDIYEQSLMDWSDPEKPRSVASLYGIPGDNKFVFGQKEGFEAKDPPRVSEVVQSLPLTLWEDLTHSAVRDIMTMRPRSALMNICLAVESYFRFVVFRNRPEVGQLENRTMKELATRTSCLPSLLGYTLNSAEAPAGVRVPFLRLSALRDSLMHTGVPCYRWPPRATTTLSIDNHLQATTHIALALLLIRAVSSALQAGGHEGCDRGMGASPEGLVSPQWKAAMTAEDQLS